MASTGLSRRRVVGSSSGSADDLRPQSPSNNNNGTTTSAGLTSHAGSAFEGGKQIAFDPRDLENESEHERLGGRPPRLTLMEEVLLLGLKDKQVRSSRWGDPL
jgi:Golgi phosphoprotein 3